MQYEKSISTVMKDHFYNELRVVLQYSNSNFIMNCE